MKDKLIFKILCIKPAGTIAFALAEPEVFGKT